MDRMEWAKELKSRAVPWATKTRSKIMTRTLKPTIAAMVCKGLDPATTVNMPRSTTATPPRMTGALSGVTVNRIGA